MAILLALASAITYGAADFMGGFVSRRTSVFSVIVVSQVFGTTLLLLALPFFAEEGLGRDAVVFGALAGVGGAVGIGFFYKGLSVGRMSVVAPISAVLAAVFPVIFGLVAGERPDALALAGVVVALAAVALISSTPSASDGGRSAGLRYAVAAGLGFALFFIFLSEAGDDSGLWPLVTGRLSSVALMVLAALLLRRSMRPRQGTLPQIATAGMLDVTANVFFLLSTRYGLLSIVAVITSLYPASTVVLARIVLDERLAPLQAVGLATAALGVGLIAAA